MSPAVPRRPCRVERVEPAPAWAVRLLNPVVSALLRSPLHPLISHTFCLLSFEGRVSGRTYSVPVTYWPSGRRLGNPRLYAQSTAQGRELCVVTCSNWWKNFRGGASAAVRLRGDWVEAVATVETDSSTVATFVHERLVEDPSNARLLGIQFEGYGIPTVDELQPVLLDMVLVRLTPLPIETRGLSDVDDRSTTVEGTDADEPDNTDELADTGEPDNTDELADTERPEDAV
ncbi:hypothetical protein [Haloarchaeobius sp. TZWWS8]|uniref:hypothetical protein n=1 Tax=Haloarchaeobius sp. TZWWS8 TaxID=3446121 RepID=UPI003EBBEA42